MTSDLRSLRGKVAIVGIGETTYYKHGRSPEPEFKLALMAILAAAEDAGIDPREIDSFASYSNDRNDPSRLAAALGTKELRLSNMQWGGGGGGGAAAVGNAAAAIVTGQADIVVVYRALAQGQFQRFGRAAARWHCQRRQRADQSVRHLRAGPALCAEVHALHARARHRAGCDARAGHGVVSSRAVQSARGDARPSADRGDVRCVALDLGTLSPVRLLPGERRRRRADPGCRRSVRKDFKHKPAYVLAVAQGSDHRNAARSFNAPDFASSSFGPVAPHLWEMAKLGPGDVDVLQSYENFTGGVLMSMAEHGFFKPEEANEFLTLENLLAPSGKLPLNTSGGNLAECYMHGLELQIEAVRQIRGQSTAQVPDAHVAGVIAGPMVTPVSTMIVGSQETL